MKRLSLGLILIFFGFVTPATALAATLSLSPSSGTPNKGCSFPVDIVLDTGGASTDGTDAILIYDPTRFTANSSSITTGSIYTDYPGNNVDDSAGKVTISGLASISSAFSGKGTLATINFTVKDTAPTGVTQIKFDFDPNDKTKTTDSNVVEHGTTNEILSSVTNGNYTIGTGSCAAASPSPTPGTGAARGAVGPGATATPSASEIPLKKTLPEGGTEQFTYTLAILGSVLTVLGILGLALL